MPRPPESDDALPPECIRLSEAFEEYYRATTADADILEKNYADLLAKPNREKNELETASDAFDRAQRAAEISFRKLCDAGFPAACVRDPVAKEIFELKRGKWSTRANFGIPGLYDDFIWEHDNVQPGPGGAIIDGSLRPVFFERAKFEAFLKGKNHIPKKRGPKDLYDWKLAEKTAFELMNDNGDFSPDDGWDSPAKLVAALQTNFFEPRQQHPSNSQMYARVGQMLKAWRARGRS